MTKNLYSASVVAMAAVGLAVAIPASLSCPASAAGLPARSTTAASGVQLPNVASVDQRLLIPAYFYPVQGSPWATLAAQGPKSSAGYVIADISGTGPGTSVNTDYTAAITAAEGAGWTVVGYVDTDYGARTAARVETEIGNWSSLYGVHDIFLDRADNTSAHVGYAAALTSYVRGLHAGAQTFLNMGAPPDAGYLSSTVCDGIVVFESPQSVFQSTPPVDYSGHGVSIGHIITGATGAAMPSQLAASKGLGADLIYITDEPDSLYSGLPTYFAAENAATAATAAAPTFTSAATATLTVGKPGTATITASGAMTIVASGTLPAGVTFVDNGNATATLAGTPAQGSAGSYPLTLTARNDSGSVTQAYTLTVTLTASQPPAFTSQPTATFAVGNAGSFTVRTSGSPVAGLALTGTLPVGITFADNGDGTATLTGTPASGTAGSYPLTVAATNPAGRVTQGLTLVVQQAPVITSAATMTVRARRWSTLTIRTSGYPTPTVTLAGSLPAGLTFQDNGNGTGTLAGTASSRARGVYTLTATASNSVGSVRQDITLTVR